MGRAVNWLHFTFIIINFKWAVMLPSNHTNTPYLFLLFSHMTVSSFCFSSQISSDNSPPAGSAANPLLC